MTTVHNCHWTTDPGESSGGGAPGEGQVQTDDNSVRRVTFYTLSWPPLQKCTLRWCEGGGNSTQHRYGSHCNSYLDGWWWVISGGHANPGRIRDRLMGFSYLVECPSIPCPGIILWRGDRLTAPHVGLWGLGRPPRKISLSFVVPPPPKERWDRETRKRKEGE